MSLARSYSQAFPFTRNFGLGINRQTWQAGYKLGSYLKRAWDQKNKRAGAKQARRTFKAKKKPILTGLVEQEGVGGQLSKCHWPKGKMYLPKSVHMALAPYFFSTNGASQLIATVGLQNVSAPFSALTSADVSTMLGKYVGGGTINRVFVDRCYGELLLCNNFLSNANVTIYDVIAREDINSTPGNTPDTAWSTGVGDEGGTGFSIVGSTPLDSELFNQYWKVQQVTRVTLAQGAMHRHRIDYRINRLFHEERVANSTVLRGATIYSLLVLSGQPDNDTVTLNQVTLGKAGLNIVRQVEYEFRFPANNSTKLYQTNNLLSAFTTADGLISTGAGTAATNAEA